MAAHFGGGFYAQIYLESGRRNVVVRRCVLGTGVKGQWLGGHVEAGHNPIEAPAGAEARDPAGRLWYEGQHQVVAQWHHSRGTTYSENFEGKADGKSYPIMRDNKEFAQVTYRWINDNSLTALVRIPDGTITSEKIDLAPNGKTMTLHLHSKSKESKVLADEVAVFRKQ
jgi:hypothetical protein